MRSQREDTSRPERGLRSRPPERLPWRHPISGSRRLPLRREPLALSATRVEAGGFPACTCEHPVYVGNLPARGRRRLGTSHPETRPTAPVRTSQLDGGAAVFGREGPWALRRRGRSVRGVVPVVSFSPAGAAPEFRSTSRPRSRGGHTRQEAPHTPGPRSMLGARPTGARCGNKVCRGPGLTHYSTDATRDRTSSVALVGRMPPLSVTVLTGRSSDGGRKEMGRVTVR